MTGEAARVRFHSDSTAAIAIATGTTSSWHLRIRAAGLTEAIKEKEITLDHVSGKVLVADGLTKQLTGPALWRFKKALGLKGAEKEPIEVKKIELSKTIEPGFTRGLGLLVAAASLLGRVEAAEVEVAETTGEWWIIVLITAAIAILVDIAFRVGASGIQRWFRPREEIKVKLLNPEARLPTRGSDQAAGLDLYSTIETLVPPGESVLIKTGIAIELPAGTYGRIAPRSSLAIRGIETGAGVVDRDFRGEVKVLLRNWSDEDLRVYKGDRVAQLVVEKILEVGVNHVEDLSETARGNRGFGYSAHEEAYPWADPDDPLYQRQELGTRTPVSRISMRAMRVTSGQSRESETNPGQTSAGDEGGASGPLSPDRPEPAGRQRAPDPDLWHRGPYDPEAEKKRRAALGLGMSAWDRMMERRGPRRNFGGTWIMMDSDGTHVIFNENGADRRIHQPEDPGVGHEREGGASSSTSRRASGLVAAETEEKEVTGGEPEAGSGKADEGAVPGQRIGMRSEALNFVSPVGNGITLGKWTLWREEVFDFLRDELFQPGFFTAALRRKMGIPPKRTAAKDTWLTIEELPDGGKVAVREHTQERKKLFDFENPHLWDEREWLPWRMTIAWTTIKKVKYVIVNERQGRRSSYLDDLWVGYTLFRTP